MKTEHAISHFKTQSALAKALRMSQSSVCEWGEYPPAARQFQIEILTHGVLQVEPHLKPSPIEA